MIATSEEALRRRLERNAIEIDQRVEGLIETNLAAVGTQAALLAGFSFSSLQILVATNRPVALYEPAVVVWQVMSTISFLIEVHVVMQTTLVNIYGPILSTNGPPGSLPIAIKAMRQEQQKIIAEFYFGCFLLVVSVTSYFWIEAKSDKHPLFFAESTSTILTVITTLG